MSSIQIHALVRQMDESIRRHKGLKRTNRVEFNKKVEQENQMLYNTLPSIYEMHIEGKLDEKFFNMLKFRRKVESGEMTQDDASKAVGQMLFDQYVAPVVGQLPAGPKPLSYEEYYQQFANNTQGEQPSSPPESSES
jgi:hypothetical protein